MNYITLNGVNIAQPSANRGVKEEKIDIVHYRTTVAGALRAYYFGFKWQVTLEWPFLAPNDYQTIMGMVQNGQVVTYQNTASGEVGGVLNFSGIAMRTTDVYLPGASLLRDFKLIIKQQ